MAVREVPSQIRDRPEKVAGSKAEQADSAGTGQISFHPFSGSLPGGFT